MYVLNSWYVAARGAEVGREPLGRTLMERPVLLYRKEDGAPVALEDRCCHRSLPLSEGRVVGDRVRCGYHGLEFDETGRCVSVPGQSSVPPDAAIATYPVVERHGWLWFWPGDRDAADPASIPDIGWMTDPGCWTFDVYWHVKSNYQLLVDIQLDATHATYVHPTTLGSDSIQDTPPEVVREGGRMHVRRWMRDVAPPPIWVKAGGFTANVDRWILATYLPPATCVFDIGAAEAGTGAPEGDRRRGITNYTAHMMTPETASTTHYFWAYGRDYRTGDAALSAVVRSNIRQTFEEDVAIVEAQQKSFDFDAPGRVDVNADKPTLLARRLVDAMLAAGQTTNRGDNRWTD